MLLSRVELFSSTETLGSVEVLAGAGFCCARDDERLLCKLKKRKTYVRFRSVSSLTRDLSRCALMLSLHSYIQFYFAQN